MGGGDHLPVLIVIAGKRVIGTRGGFGAGKTDGGDGGGGLVAGSVGVAGPCLGGEAVGTAAVDRNDGFHQRGSLLPDFGGGFEPGTVWIGFGAGDLVGAVGDGGIGIKFEGGGGALAHWVVPIKGADVVGVFHTQELAGDGVVSKGLGDGTFGGLGGATGPVGGGDGGLPRGGAVKQGGGGFQIAVGIDRITVSHVGLKVSNGLIAAAIRISGGGLVICPASDGGDAGGKSDGATDLGGGGGDPTGIAGVDGGGDQCADGARGWVR